MVSIWVKTVDERSVAHSKRLEKWPYDAIYGAMLPTSIKCFSFLNTKTMMFLVLIHLQQYKTKDFMAVDGLVGRERKQFVWSTFGIAAQHAKDRPGWKASVRAVCDTRR